VKEVGGCKVGLEGDVRRVVHWSHAEKGDRVVRSGLVIVTLSGMGLMGVFWIRSLGVIL